MIDLPAIKARLAASTPGEWRQEVVYVCRGSDGSKIAECYTDLEDAEFIAHAPQDIPDLIRELEAAQALIRELVAKSSQLISSIGDCTCGNAWVYRGMIDPDCDFHDNNYPLTELSVVLARVPEELR